MKNIARVMGLLFGSAGAHIYPKFGQVAFPPPPSLEMRIKFGNVMNSLLTNLIPLKIQIWPNLCSKSHIFLNA